MYVSYAFTLLPHLTLADNTDSSTTRHRSHARTRQRHHATPTRNRRLRTSNRRSRRGRRRPTRDITPVVRHMCLDKVTSAQGAVEGKFTSQHTRGNDTGELARVVAWRGGVSAADAEEVEHSRLGLEDGAAADGADFDGGHGDGDLEVAFYAGGGVSGFACVKMSGMCMLDLLVHDGDAIG
jgi:hypothetical protein